MNYNLINKPFVKSILLDVKNDLKLNSFKINNKPTKFIIRRADRIILEYDSLFTALNAFNKLN